MENNMKKIILFVSALIMIVNSIYAADIGCSIDDKTGCATKAYEKADKELNNVYSIIRKWLGKKYRLSLKDAEIAWMKYRDLNCETEKEIIGSGIVTGQEMIDNAKTLCLQRMTIQRIKELRSVYSWGRGFPFEDEE